MGWRTTPRRRSIALEDRQGKALEETVERLRVETAELAASRKRLVLAADADRRRIERDLHEGVQQRLVALAVNLQLATELADSDPPAARALLETMARDVQETIDDTAHLAERIYPPLLGSGGLVTALRAAAARAGARTSIEVPAGTDPPAEIATTLLWCCFEALEGGAAASVTVRGKGAELAFELAGGGGLAEARGRLRDRVEALGGRLTIDSEPAGETRIAGSLPLAR